MEEKLAKLSAGIVGGSFIATALVFILLVGIPQLFSGSITSNTFFLKAFIIASVYVYSVFLVATLPGKPVKRRACSWGFSILFHSFLLIYLSVINNWGSAIFFIGMAETAVLIFSVIGMGLLVYGNNKKPVA